jgi:hypothetical protein
MTERQRNRLAWNNSVELQAMITVKNNGDKLVANGFGHLISSTELRKIEQYMIQHNKNSKTMTFNEIANILTQNRSN